jgi:hypothetical protein
VKRTEVTVRLTSVLSYEKLDAGLAALTHESAERFEHGKSFECIVFTRD